jgi:hypothetical protein
VTCIRACYAPNSIDADIHDNVNTGVYARSAID